MTVSSRLFRNLFGPREAPPSQVTAAEPVREPKTIKYSFGKLGEQGEEVSERIALLANRFEELQTMRSDFDSVIKPLLEVASAHSQAQTRIAEQDAILVRHLQTAKDLRRELTELQNASASTQSELIGARHQILALQQQSDNDSETIKLLKIDASDAAFRLSAFNTQLIAEMEKNATLEATIKAKEADLVETEHLLNVSQARAAELEEALGASKADGMRLHAIAAQIQPELARSKQRILELETALHTMQLNVQAHETRAFQDQRERDALLSKHAAEKGDLEASLAAMTLQVDNISSRHAATLKHLEQSRQLCNEKIELAQKLERSSKEMLGALTVAERRLNIAEENIRKISDQNRSLEQVVAESRARNDMLTKAMAAKDIIIAQLETKAANFENHHAALTQELENEKQKNETAKCKLVEELESERAERALVQGALAIARASREKMAAQMEALKRPKLPLELNSNLSETHKPASDDSVERETNVHFFRPNDSDGA